jgi:hypothetical protein
MASGLFDLLDQAGLFLRQPLVVIAGGASTPEND